MGSGSSTPFEGNHCLKCDRSGRPVVLYMSPLSPASRAVTSLLKHVNVPYTCVNIDLQQGEHKTHPDLAKVHPMKVVPALEVDNFKIWESRAIMMYVMESLTACGHHPAASCLFPPGALARARLHHAMYFDGCSLFPAVQKCIRPLITGAGVPEAEDVTTLTEVMAVLDEHILGGQGNPGDGSFVAGRSLTVADFTILQSVLSTELLEENFCFKFPRVKKWLMDLKTRDMAVEFRECNKEYFELVLALRDAKAGADTKEGPDGSQKIGADD